MKEFRAAWLASAAMAAGAALILAIVGEIIGSRVAWSVAAGIVLGIVDLVGLGMRLPMWAKLGHRAATLSMNLRLLSRLILLGVSFYALKRFTHLSLGAALIGIFVPHVMYLGWVIWQHKGKGVNG